MVLDVSVLCVAIIRFERLLLNKYQLFTGEVTSGDVRINLTENETVKKKKKRSVKVLFIFRDTKCKYISFHAFNINI